MFDRKYNVNLPWMTFKGVSFFSAILLFVLGLVLLFAILAGMAYGFIFLWAWYVPVFWAGAPMLDFWHSFVTMILLLAFLRRGGGKDK